MKTFRIALSEPNRCPYAHLEASKSCVKWLGGAQDTSTLQDDAKAACTRSTIESAARLADDGAWRRRHAGVMPVGTQGVSFECAPCFGPASSRKADPTALFGA